MNRKTFISRLLAVPALLVGAKLLPTPEPEGKSMFDQKRLQDQLDYLEKHPPSAEALKRAADDLITYGRAEVFTAKDGSQWLVTREIEDAENRLVSDFETRIFLPLR